VQSFVESLGPAMMDMEGSVRKVADTVIAAADAMEAEASDAPPSVEPTGTQADFVRLLKKILFPVMTEEVRAAANRVRTVAESVRVNVSNANGVAEVNEISDTKEEETDKVETSPASETSPAKNHPSSEVKVPSNIEVKPVAKIPSNIEVSTPTSKESPTVQLKSPPSHVETKIPSDNVSSPVVAQLPTPVNKAEPPVEIPENGRPFIHGRHTCDGCLTTPIVGKRYHAVNLPDYDLCENCVKNYSGENVNFEPVELDRDSIFQDRWHRRRARWASHGRNHARGCREPSGHNHGGPRRQYWQQQQEVNKGGVFSPAPGHVVPTSDQVDAALKEAIRRSLIDFKQSNDSNEKSVTEVSDSVKNEKEISKTEVIQKDEETHVAKKPVDLSELKNEQPVVTGSDTSEGMNNEEDIVVTGLVTMSESEEPEIVLPRIESAEPEIIVESVHDEPTTVASKRTSFGTDAEEFGDIAVVLGEALDKVALSIDELNTELDRSSESDRVTITEGKDDNDNDDASDDLSEGSWNVVADEQLGDNEALARAAHVIGSALFNSDMAHSHEEVSMMSHSQVTTPSESSSGASFSSVESVPTILPSIATAKQPSVASAMQHECWAPQLEHLHELGFLNDNLLIETIERLNAANIGVDCTDDVTVQQIIEELMKEW
jgi:hypothetical protein